MGRRILRLGLALLCAASLVGTAFAAPARTDPDDALLFDLRVAGTKVGDGVRGANTPAGVCVALPDVVAGLKLAITIDERAGTATGWAFKESRTIAIDRTTRRISYAGRAETAAENVFWDDGSHWCVLAQELAKWLGVVLDVDVGEATIAVRSDGALPVEAAMRRAALAALLKESAAPEPPPLPHVALPYRPWRMPSMDVNIGIGAERTDGGRSAASARYEIFATGELAYLSADARLIAEGSAVPEALRLRLHRDDPDARLLGPLHATQLALGDVLGATTPLVAQGMPGRGLALSNRPIEQAGQFDAVTFAGDLPTGWDVELYRNGELIAAAASRGDGRYEFRDVPLQFGANAFEVVSYGPQGQVRRQSRSYPIGARAVPRGQTWWWATAVQAGRDLIMLSRPALPVAGSGWRTTIGAEHGVAAGWSVGAAFHDVNRGSGHARYVDGAVRGPVGPVLAAADVAWQIGGGKAGRLTLLGRAAGFNLSFEGLRNDRLASDQLDAQLHGRLRLTADRPVRVAGLLLPLHFNLTALETDQDRTTEAGARLSAGLPGLAISTGLKWRRVRVRAGPTRDEADATLLFNTRVAGVRLRGAAQWRVMPDVRFDGLQLTANWSVGDRAAFQASAGYAPAPRTLSAGLGYTRDFGRFSLNAGGDVNSRGAGAARVGVLFNVGGSGRFGRLSSKAQAASGAIAVRLFRDDNGDGRWDAGETPVEGGDILVNEAPAGSPPHERKATRTRLVAGLDHALPVRVAIDKGTLADPFDVPSTAGVMVVPRAGTVTPVDLGVIGTGTVEGVLALRGAPASGMAVELVTTAGQVVAAARTEFDGQFAFEGVRFGSYRLHVVDASAAIADVTLSLSAARPVRRVALGNDRAASALAAR